MNPADRLSLMKKRLNAVRGYSLPALPAVQPKAKVIVTGERSQYPLGVSSCVNPAEWVNDPDAKPNATTPRITRKPRVSPLVKIAAHYPVRLPRRT